MPATRFLSVVASLSLLVLLGAHAADVKAPIALKSDSSDVSSVTSGLFAQHGYQVAHTNDVSAVRSGYIVNAKAHLTGKNFDDLTMVRGGATLVIASYRCNSELDIFIGHASSGYYGYGPYDQVPPAIRQVVEDGLAQEISMMVTSESWLSAPARCKQYVRSIAPKSNPAAAAAAK